MNDAEQHEERLDKLATTILAACAQSDLSHRDIVRAVLQIGIAWAIAKRVESGVVTDLFLNAISAARLIKEEAPEDLSEAALRMKLNDVCSAARGQLPDERIAEIVISYGTTIASAMGNSFAKIVEWARESRDGCERAWANGDAPSPFAKKSDPS